MISSRSLRALDLTLAVEIERRGRVAPGQPVDEVFIAFDGDADAQTFGPLVLELGLVALVVGGQQGEALGRVHVSGDRGHVRAPAV